MMMNLDKRELRIFLTFFMIYSFFMYWSSWSEDSRLSLTRAIVDEARFEIDSFYNQTGDRSYFQGHYYSDKEPGISFLATPIYFLWKFIYYNFFSKNSLGHYGTNEYFIENVLVIHYINPGLFTRVAMMFLTVFTSSFFSALTVLLLYKISGYITTKHRMLLSVIGGLGTLIFPNALMFRDYGVSTFLSFLSFYLLFKAKQKSIEDKCFTLSGMLAGLAISLSVMSMIIGFACFLYLLFFYKNRLPGFLLAGFVGVLPFLLYNSFLFGFPFTLPRFYLDPAIWVGMVGFKGVNRPNPYVALRLMFYPFRGLFFYYPILFISLLSLFLFHKKFRVESVLIFLIFLLTLLANSSWWAWWGGSSFGPKHLALTAPFLVLPLSLTLAKTDEKKMLKIPILILVILSIFHNFAGLRHVPDELVDLGKRTQIRPEYRNRINTFEILMNPLYEYYIPSFLKDGPRSKLFESLFNPPINICMPPACGASQHLEVREVRLFSLASRTFVLKIPFLCLVPLSLMIFGIWHRDILNNKKIKRYLNGKRILLVSLIFVLLLFLLFIRL